MDISNYICNKQKNYDLKALTGQLTEEKFTLRPPRPIQVPLQQFPSQRIPSPPTIHPFIICAGIVLWLRKGNAVIIMEWGNCPGSLNVVQKPEEKRGVDFWYLISVTFSSPKITDKYLLEVTARDFPQDGCHALEELILKYLQLDMCREENTEFDMEEGTVVAYRNTKQFERLPFNIIQ